MWHIIQVPFFLTLVPYSDEMILFKRNPVTGLPAHLSVCARNNGRVTMIGEALDHNSPSVLFGTQQARELFEC